jgi:hypothetical protein
VVLVLLQLHLTYAKDYGTGAQGTTFLEAKKKDQQSKFETNQRNRESELAKRHQMEEDEHKKAAKNRKIAAGQLVRMADCFERISSAASQDVSKIVEEKLEQKSPHQRQMMDSVQQMLGNFLQQILQNRNDQVACCLFP